MHYHYNMKLPWLPLMINTMTGQVPYIVISLFTILYSHHFRISLVNQILYKLSVLIMIWLILAEAISCLWSRRSQISSFWVLFLVHFAEMLLTSFWLYSNSPRVKWHDLLELIGDIAESYLCLGCSTWPSSWLTWPSVCTVQPRCLIVGICEMKWCAQSFMIWQIPWSDESLWNNTHKCRVFVGFAVCLVVWTPLIILKPSHVGISQAVQKKQITNRIEGRNRQRWI